MNVENIVVKNIVTTTQDEKVSKVISLMEARKLHQIPVMEGKEIAGMIFLRDIVLEDVDISTTSVRALMKKNAPSIDGSSTEAEAAALMIESGVRALAVYSKSRLVGVVSETELLPFVKQSVFAEELMSEPFTIEQNESIGKAKQIMREKHVSRLPVVDDNRNLVGVIDTIDLIKSTNPKERQTRSFEGPGQNTPLSRVPVKAIMRSPATIGKKSDTNEIIKALLASEEAVVADGKKVIGIITPKDILELIVPRKQESRIQIAHLDKDDMISKSIIYEALEKWIKKTGISFDYIYIYVHRHHSNGRIKYTLSMRMRNQMGLFVVKSVEWDMLSCVQDLVRKAQKIMDKKHGKLIDKRKKRI